MKITKSSPALLALIQEFEGFESTPYLCPALIPTIGYGVTRYPNGKRVTLQDKPITKSEALIMLRYTIEQYEMAVDSFCRDDINQNQFDALVDFAYNCGVGNLKSSTLLKKVNNNPSDPAIKKEFAKWVYADGRAMKGLAKRRAAESKLYFS